MTLGNYEFGKNYPLYCLHDRLRRTPESAAKGMMPNCRAGRTGMSPISFLS